MSSILLVRHAQSANNAQPEHLRVCDPGLTELGYRQAQRLADSLANCPPRALFCSPFLRSLETTRLIANRLKMAATIRSDLFELGGCYSGHLPSQKIGQPGMGRSDLSNGYPEWSVDPRIAESGWWGRPFESQSEASQRAVQVQRWLETEVCDDSRHLDLLVIHADFKRVLILQLLGTHWSQEHSEQLGDLFNTGISNLQFSQGRWVMNCYNSTFHLASDEVTS